MDITCPAADDHVKVTGGSGTTMTICVHGTVTAGDTADITIRVRVVAGHVDPATVSPNGDPHTDTTAVGTFWCAKGVVVPAAGGAALTVVAWRRLVNSSGTHWVSRRGIWFYGGGTGTPRDCCSECTSESMMRRALAAAGALEVSVPDGPSQGRHRAVRNAPMSWTLRIGKEDVQVYFDPAARLVIRTRGLVAPCSSLELNPFSATFPGAVFGATGPVVVTQE